jgi:hypothetical protein
VVVTVATGVAVAVATRVVWVGTGVAVAVGVVSDEVLLVHPDRRRQHMMMRIHDPGKKPFLSISIRLFYKIEVLKFCHMHFCRILCQKRKNNRLRITENRESVFGQ